MATREHDLKIGSITPFGLRLHPDLKRKLEDAARRSGRSLNAEISARLEASLDGDGDQRSEEAARNLLRSGMGDELEKRVVALERAVSQMVQSDRSYDHEIRITRLESKV